MGDRAVNDLDKIRRSALRASKIDGQETRAADLLKSYLKLRPKDGVAWLKYGVVLSTLGSRKKALSALKKAVKLVPERDRYVALSATAIWYDDFGSQKEAKKWFARATEGSRYLPGIWCLRGANLRDLGENGKALECFEIAMKLDSEDQDEVRLNIAGLRGTH